MKVTGRDGQQVSLSIDPQRSCTLLLRKAMRELATGDTVSGFKGNGKVVDLEKTVFEARDIYGEELEALYEDACLFPSFLVDALNVIKSHEQNGYATPLYCIHDGSILQCSRCITSFAYQPRKQHMEVRIRSPSLESIKSCHLDKA